MDSLEATLAKATHEWTDGFCWRDYEDSKNGLRSAEQERVVLVAHGYLPVGESMQNDGDRHINKGRTAAKLVLTGGLGLIVSGRSRSQGMNWMSVRYHLDGPVFQPRQVTIYDNMTASGLRATQSFKKIDGVSNVRFALSGTVVNQSPNVAYERAEFEVAVYRTPDLTRIELGRFEAKNLGPGASASFEWRGEEHHSLDYNHAKATQVLVVPRRAMPRDGIWDDPEPRRVLHAQLFPPAP